MIGAFGPTEADAGSDPASMATRAERVQGGYVLSRAQRCGFPLRPSLDVFVVWAKLEGRLGALSLEKASRGLSAPQKLRASSACGPL